MMHEQKFYTIGVYGSNETSFFDKLRTYQIDTFCDIRQRRGMRGSTYAYVNSRMLQSHLADMNIHYVHVSTLAPHKTTRSVQVTFDMQAGILKRQRESLSPEFIQAYQNQCLEDLNEDEFLRNLGSTASNICLFCVERLPQACHRSLLAKYLIGKGFQVEDIIV